MLAGHKLTLEIHVSVDGLYCNIGVTRVRSDVHTATKRVKNEAKH